MSLTTDNQSLGHSPGPWTIESDADTFEYDIKAGDFYVAAIPDVPGRTLANARLIAAAPDVYHALREFIDDEPCRLDHEGYCQTHQLTRPCIMVKAKNAIALVEGSHP
jgi:hypothetical protein